MPEAEVAIIGGSGFYDLPGLQSLEERLVATPYGEPSDAIAIGAFQGRRVAFLARHGKGHRLLPSEVNSRANIWALKSLGVARIVSVSAVGSLRIEMAPRDFVVPDQLIDRTRGRPSTFFGDGVIAHIGFAEPYCPQLRALAVEAVRQAGARVHSGGTLVVMEGPAFSTRAESELYRSWGASLIGMTALPEAKLAREAEICYVTLAAVTDYDCWHDTHETVSASLIFENLRANTENGAKALAALLASIPEGRDCPCGSALKDALAPRQLRTAAPARIRDLQPILAPYLPAEATS
jgi:5'-methylthioadenosine phosphorylase